MRVPSAVYADLKISYARPGREGWRAAPRRDRGSAHGRRPGRCGRPWTASLRTPVGSVRSVREHRHRDPRVAAEQHGPGDRRGAEPVADRRRARRRARRCCGGRTGSASWTASSSSTLRDADPDQRDATRVDQRGRGVEQHARRRRGSCRCGPSRAASVCERVARVKSSKRSRSTTVRPTRSRGAHPVRDPVDEPDEDGVDRRRATRGQRPSARCDPIDRRRRPTCTGRGSRLWARACRWRPDARTEQRDEHPFLERRDLADRA